MWWKILLGIVVTLIIAVTVLMARVGITPAILTSSLFGKGIETPEEATVRSTIKVPEGFSVGVYAGNVTNARFIEFSESGDLIVAQPRESKITLIQRDANADGASDGSRVLLDKLVRPHSIDFHDGYLYIAESNAVGRIQFDHESGTTSGDYERIITGLGDSGNHWSKSIRFGPDGWLYLSTGSSCNVCIEEDARRATILRYQPDGSGEEIYATGLRNSVGFDWSPDGILYATDNGRDLLGDDYPPCELNRIEQGNFYGWPHVNGFGDLDPDFGDRDRLAEAVPPVHGFNAHNAPLGIRFVSIEKFPEEFRGAALVALHGSWNRSTYDGYKVVSVHPKGDGFEEQDFLSGFNSDGGILGRPVDIAAGPDGCAYVSDDYAMAIYRVCYGEEQTTALPAASAAPGETGLEGYTPEELRDLASEGQKLFQTRGCLACHVAGSERKASFGMRVLKDLDQKYSVSSLRSFFKTPTPPMPPVRLGSDEEALALSAYLLQLD